MLIFDRIEPSSFLYEDLIPNDINNSSNEENDNEIQHEVRTRYGRRIIKPKWFINFALLLISLVTSQFVQVNSNFHYLIKENDFSFF